MGASRTRIVLDQRDLEIVHCRPDRRLRTCVRRYWGYFERGSGFSHTRELPSADVTLIIGFGPPIGITYPRHNGAMTARHTSFIAGLHDSYVVVQAGEWQSGIEVNLTPLGTYLLLGVPMEALTNRVVDLEDLLGGAAALLVEQLHEAPSWDARFDLVDEFVAARLAQARPPSPSVAWAWKRLGENRGRLEIGALAGELGCSRKHLIAQFREQVGLPPKMVARILRFRGVLESLERGNGTRLAEVAQECGYYDQAHLNRDFREFAGITPTEFLDRRLPGGEGSAVAT
ncbi:MAG TPA: helix-turn-helix domain-containing protein [Solirubrobacterales bacterium]|jgi:AraC-like DNA-binding protein|nr:helix-turn-helix domain-containing protein [Solirubrobacterales bacterium]